MASIAISSSHEELYNAVMQQKGVYQTEIVGKPFDQFLKSKYQKPPRYTQIASSRKEYDELFRSKLALLLPQLQTLFDNASIGGKMQTQDRGLMVVGSADLRNSRHCLQNFEPLSEREGDSGAIFAPHKWSLLRNDLMMLASVRAEKVFFLALPQKQSLDDQKGSSSESQAGDPFWDFNKGQPRILAREIAILLGAGYAPVSHPYKQSLGMVFTCNNPDKAAAFTLAEVNLAAAKLRNPQSLPELLEKYTLQSET